LFRIKNKAMIQPKESKSNSHFWISLVKSGLRFGACFTLYYLNFTGAALLLGLAEVLGVAEEIF
jgi:hypothetical protein